MKQGIQTFFKEAGEAACYALDIISIAEEYLDAELSASDCLIGGIDHGYIHYSWNNPSDDNNFYVGAPQEFIGWITKQPWTVKKETPDYKPLPDEYVVQRWERVENGVTIGHFRRPLWDSLLDSQCVKRGKIVSLRVFRRA